MPKDIQDTPQLLGEISQAPSAFEQFLERNQKGLVVVAIVAALAGCGWVVYRSKKAGEEQDAGSALIKAESLTDLQAISKTYPGTPAAGSAIVLTADKQWADGQQDASIESLKSFIQNNPTHPAKASAQASLGAKLMAQGKNAEAETAFQAVLSDSTGRFLAPYALTQLGDLAKLAGDLDKAKGYYDKAKNDYGDNIFSGIASQHLLILKAKAPTEIEPRQVTPPPTPGLPNIPGFPAGGADDVAPGQLQPGGTGGAPFGGLLDLAPAGEPAPAPAEPAPATPAK
ncbi:MAG: tetratricopeptide repeat protein [Luteolibacter sp.]